MFQVCYIYVRCDNRVYIKCNYMKSNLFLSSAIPPPKFSGDGEEVDIRDSRFDSGDEKYTPRYHFYSVDPSFDSEAQRPSNSFFTTDRMFTILSNVSIG